MPNPTKKVMVKVPKKTAETKVEMEAYVPAGLTKDTIDKINETTDINKKRLSVESAAKSDSISGAKKAKFEGKDLVDQRRAGNQAANVKRKEGGVPEVSRGRYTNTEPDKYWGGGYNALTSDAYVRDEPLEKEMPVVKKVLVKKAKKA